MIFHKQANGRQRGRRLPVFFCQGTHLPQHSKKAFMSKLEELNFNDVTKIGATINYYDDQVAFADNITSIPELENVFKLNFIAVIFCLGGTLQIKINAKEYSITAQNALFINSRSIVSDIRHEGDFSCKIVAMASENEFSFINKSLFEAVMSLSNDPIIKFSADEMTLLVKYYELSMFKITNTSLHTNREAVMHILQAFALDLIACINSHKSCDNSDDMMRQGDKLFRDFMLMLSNNVNNLRSVQAFADRLCVSPKYLTSVCNQRSNKSAGDLITLSFVNRIKQLLLYSDMSVKEIANSLNFENLSFFGKYVRKHLGASPNKFRKNNDYGN